MNSHQISKAILGTANLGFKYGITNNEQYSVSNSKRILKLASKKGIAGFDTAPDYGISEELLGNESSVTSNLRIITKIPARTEMTITAVLESLKISLKRLNRDSVTSVLFHDSQAYKSKNFKKIVTELAQSGLTKTVGVSVYSAEEIYRSLDASDKLCSFQIPENLLDRSLAKNQRLIDLKKEGKVLTVRSIFLQGTLLLKSENLPSNLKSYSNIFDSIQEMCDKNNVSRLELCLSYAYSLEWATEIIFSAATSSQLRSILKTDISILDFSSLAKLPKPILDPRTWS